VAFAGTIIVIMALRPDGLITAAQIRRLLGLGASADGLATPPVERAR
jgi:hypothetical protein